MVQKNENMTSVEIVDTIERYIANAVKRINDLKDGGYGGNGGTGIIILKYS
jgi:hypothetical protein